MNKPRLIYYTTLSSKQLIIVYKKRALGSFFVIVICFRHPPFLFIFGLEPFSTSRPSRRHDYAAPLSLALP